MARIRESIKINNKLINNPVEFADSSIEIKFNENALNNTQPVVNLDILLSGQSLEVFQEALKQKGYYTKIPFTFDYANTNFLNGYLDNYEFMYDRDKALASFVADDSVGALGDLLASVLASSLVDDYKYTEIPFIIEKTEIGLELLILLSQTFIYTYLLYAQIKDAAFFFARVSEAAADSASLSFGATIALAFEGVAIGVFLLATLNEMAKLYVRIKELILPTKRIARGVSAYELMRAPLEKIGYEFESNISELHNIIHWSSGSINDDIGHPRAGDVCYNALRVFELFTEKFNAQINIVDKKVYFLTKDDEYFYRKSEYVLPDIIDGNYIQNYKDQKTGRLITYQYDSVDDWTSQDSKGFRYLTTSFTNDLETFIGGGYEETNLGVSLASRKSELNLVEKAFKGFAKFANKAINQFKGSNKNTIIPDALGFAKISNETLGVAKLVYLENGKIPIDHRDKLSAKTDELSYHYTKSLVQNPSARKRRIIDTTIPFTFNDYQKVIQNAYFVDNLGRKGRFISLNWKPDRDVAVCEVLLDDDFEVNLIEKGTETEL